MAQDATLHMTVDTTAHALVFELAPVTIPGGQMMETPARSMALPVDGWLQGYAVDLVDANGHPLSHNLIHHVNLIAPERRELFSPIMLRIGAVGAETPAVELPRLFGFRVRPGDTLLVTAMLQNPTAHDIIGARVIVRMPFASAGGWWHPISIYPMYMDVMPPAGPKSYDMPAGHSEQSWTARPAVAGRILGIGAHVHKYATALRFEDVTAHRVIWNARPIMDRSGEPIDMPLRTYWWRLGLPLDPTHEYRVTAVYENPTGHVIPMGAMGALGGVIVPDNPGDWPRVDRGSSDYVLDLHSTTTRDSSMAMGEMAGMH
ncbi:MAG TPA: hypothetical protein VNW46_05345 [Gemmatimonadaceae bacterium]|nr:hypothetical protein [Gemmatimonadaceae bacterium]